MATVDEAETHRLELASVADIGFHAPGKPTHGELTVQSLFAGAIVAAIMGAVYPYMVLKLGFGPNVSIVSAFFGFVILSVIARKSYDRWQNNIVQTAGTSAAQTAFMCGILAAFDMLRARHDYCRDGMLEDQLLLIVGFKHDGVLIKRTDSPR